MRKSNIIRGILLRLANICGGSNALANIGALRQPRLAVSAAGSASAVPPPALLMCPPCRCAASPLRGELTANGCASGQILRVCTFRAFNPGSCFPVRRPDLPVCLRQGGPPRGPQWRSQPFKPFAARWQTSAGGKQTEPKRCLSESHSLRIRQRGPGALAPGFLIWEGGRV